jgi:ADP-ribose pyrophosphatase
MAAAWQRIEPTTSQKVGWRTLVEKTFVLPDGATKSFTTMNPEGTECAGAIALTTDNKVIVARQFRVGPEKIMDDLPGGFVDPDEDKEAAVCRELREETGYQAGEVTYMGQITMDGYSNAVHHYFLITNCTLSPDGDDQDEGEVVEVVLVSPEQFLQNAKDGRMTDAGAVLLAYDYLKSLT